MTMLISIIGVDCAGKSTQIRLLKEFYRDLNISVASVSLFQKPTISNIQKLALKEVPQPENFPFNFSGDHFAMAMNCDFLNHYCNNILPILENNDYELLLSDRYTICYKAYAKAVGATSNISYEFLDSVIKPPDFQIFLDLDYLEVVNRISERNSPRDLDETHEVLNSLIKYYRKNYKLGCKSKLIDASKPINEITINIFKLIEQVRNDK